MIDVFKRVSKFFLAHKKLSTVSLFLIFILTFCLLYFLVFSRTTVPNLVGKDLREARKLVAAKALKLKVSERKFSSAYAKGEIITQTPKAGKKISKQSVVEVVVSKGTKSKPVDYVLVPDVQALSQDMAESKLEGDGLKVEVKEEESAIPYGVVISQDPAAGIRVKKGTVVKLVVSAGTSGAEKTNGKVVCIDAGHQAKGDLNREPIGPGSSTTKEKVRGGARGVSSGMPEYEITLDISLKLKSLLEGTGYQVVMVRETHDVNVSASERAQIANNAGADLFVRIHCDGSNNSSAHGISTLYPASNQWTAPIYAESKRAAQIIQLNLVRVCGRADRGIIARDDITGFNWSKVPVVLVESGFLSNSTEDIVLNSEDGQQKVAQGILDGVVEYFKGE